MCGRFTLTVPARNIEEAFGLYEGLEPDLAPRYNIAPTQSILALRHVSPDQPPAYCRLRWGLVPSWADDLSIGHRLINARAEGIADKPSFRAAFKRRRCLIPTDGFYEWQTRPGAPTADGKKTKAVKLPFHIHRKDRGVMAFAGLWERWDRGDQPIETCTIITTDANELARPLHDRMPVILDPRDFARWLSPEPQDPAILLEMLRPYPASEMAVDPAAPRVNDVRHDDRACLIPEAL